MPATEHNHSFDFACLFTGTGAVQYHVGGYILCCLGRMEEADHHLPWQATGPLGTQGTIEEDPANYRPEVWGWSLPDSVSVGAAESEWPDQTEDANAWASES